LPSRASWESASPIGGLIKPATLRQLALAFIRWRKAKGYIVTPFKRLFWGRHAWKLKNPAIIKKRRAGLPPSPSITHDQMEFDL
jgi:hypothetical protein